MTNSIHLFPIEETQRLRTSKLKTDFRFGSYSSYLQISNNTKTLDIELDQKVIKSNVLDSIKSLSATYSQDIEYLEELFKIVVSKIDKMTEEKQDELARYFLKNVHQEEVK